MHLPACDQDITTPVRARVARFGLSLVLGYSFCPIEVSLAKVAVAF